MPPPGRSTPAKGAGSPIYVANRPRQAPLTQLQIDTPGGPQAMEVTKPVPIVSAQVVAKVGDELVMAADLLPTVNAIVDQQLKPHGDQITPEQREQFFQMVMHQQVMQAVQFKLVVAAMKKDIPKDKYADVEKEILKQFDKMALPGLKEHWKAKTVGELEAKLKEKGTSLKAQKHAFIDQAFISEWMKKEVKFDEHVSHEQMLKYYDDHQEEYKFKAKARFEEIRINYGKQRTQGAAWEQINRLAGQVQNGARWADIAKAHSDAINAEKGGLNDWTNEGSRKPPELDRALFQLPIGALSKVIDDGRGFTIVRVVERADAGITSFFDAQADIKKTIRADREKQAREKRLAAFMEKEKPRAWTMYDDKPLDVKPPPKQAKKPANSMIR